MRKTRMVAAVAVASTMLLLTAGTGSALGARVADPIPTLIPTGDLTVGLETVASGFNGPVTATHAPGDDEHLYVVEQSGKIWQVDIGEHGMGAKRLFADLSGVVIPLGCFFINYDERGLFGLAFHPDYTHNGLIYTYSSQTPAGQPAVPANRCNSRTPDHDNVVTEWRVAQPRSSEAMVDAGSAREVLRNPHPQFNHNGGELRFGPDELLYVAIGDGGSADDQGPGHAPGGNAQDLSSLNGKILRIDPNAGAMTPGHSVPKGNPFVGVPGARGEIFALGFRNPFKMSFDGESRRLYVADVGQNDVEEIDLVTKGGNYGWPVKEGTFAFNDNGTGNGFVTADVISGRYIDPIAQYDHCAGPVSTTQVGPCPKLEGTAVVGGFVYHGHEVDALKGRYVFGDYSRSFFSSDGRLFTTGAKGGPVSQLRLAGGGELKLGLLGIGEDGDGELYVLGKSGAVPGNTGITDPSNTSGVVLRIVSADDHHGHDD